LSGLAITTILSRNTDCRCLEPDFGPALHTKRLLSLSLATVGVCHAPRASIAEIGRNLAAATGKSPKHCIKQVDRLLSNDGFPLEEVLPTYIRVIGGDREAVTLAMDWTEYPVNGHPGSAAGLQPGLQAPGRLDAEGPPRSPRSHRADVLGAKRRVDRERGLDRGVAGSPWIARTYGQARACPKPTVDPRPPLRLPRPRYLPGSASVVTDRGGNSRPTRPDSGTTTPATRRPNAFTGLEVNDLP
jgi:hypothetical protein